MAEAQPVAAAIYRVNILVATRVGLDLASQIQDVHVNGAVRTVVVVALRPLQQERAGKSPPRLPHQYLQQPELGGG